MRITKMKIQSQALIEAHRIKKSMRRLGENWDWARCMRYGWNKALGKRKMKRKSK